MSDRRSELERKKQKLAMIREEKERRRREKSQEAIHEKPSVQEPDLRAQAYELLESLGIPAESKGSIFDEKERKKLVSPFRIDARGDGLFNTEGRKSAMGQLEIMDNHTATLKKTVLSVVNVHQLNIPPKENVSYNKETQTASLGSDREARPLDYYVIHWDGEWDDEFQVLTYNDASVEDDIEGSSLTSHDMDTPPLYPPMQHSSHKLTGLPNVEVVRPSLTEMAVTTDSLLDVEKKKKPKICDLSEEEKKQIMLKEDFHCFFDRATRIVERVLGERVDILADYTGSREDQEGDDKMGMKLSYNRSFFDEQWSRNRTVTSFDWSTQFPELLAASYNNNEGSPNDPDGVCLIWNMKFKKETPEYIFHCQSAVMSTCFAKFHPNLLLAGTYSGQIVLWDNRCNKRTPVQRSPLSAVAHTHPVYCIQVVGTQNAHNLVSVSTDGKFCSWSLDMLSAPQDTMELSHQKQSRSVSVTTMSFPAGDFNNFIVGSEDGTIYTACRHGSKAGILDGLEGHQGPITSISTHTASGPIDFSHLYLTSSIDWTVKLWSLKNNKPLYSFENNGDYVYDATWSPVHPGLFACVDGMGHLDIWNLNNDTELPMISVTVDPNVALNRVSFAPSGNQIAVGDDLGKIQIYDIGEQLANPHNDDWSKFAQTLQELENNKADQEVDPTHGMSGGNLYMSAIR